MASPFLSAGIKGSLDNEGGSVKFLQTGTNILTASVTDGLTSDLQGQDVTWTLAKDGQSVSLTDNMLGDLGNLGGKVRFQVVGTYTLTASAVDALGREYSCAQTIKIYPVVGLTVSTNDMSHTDTAAGG